MWKIKYSTAAKTCTTLILNKYEKISVGFNSTVA